MENQIGALLWADAVFRTFNEARRLHVKMRDPATGYFGTVIALLDKNFLGSQTMAIRRLTDRHSADSNRAVVSFPSIVSEIKEAQYLYTRENYVCYDGVPYDGRSMDDSDTYAVAATRHRMYDLLSGCSDAQRSREDRICPEVFQGCDEGQEQFEVLKTYANKYLAHAAHPDNRGKANDVLDHISLRRFDECYRVLFRMASIVGALVDQHIVCTVAVSEFDQLKDWDRPIVTRASLQDLHRYWNDRLSEIMRWGEGATFRKRDMGADQM